MVTRNRTDSANTSQRDDSVTSVREVLVPDPEETKIERPATIRELRLAIPDHCFHRSAWKTSAYILRDAALSIGLLLVASWIPSLQNGFLRAIAWATYGFFQGLVFTGIWIIAHECGHRALFEHDTTNAAVGFVLHSILLVPFFSWKYSHASHHRYTNHMEKDTAFVPHTVQTIQKRSAWRVAVSEMGEDAPFFSLINLFGHQLIGWPLYLFFHVTTGPKSGRNDPAAPEPIWLRNHFNPWSNLFTPQQRFGVFLSDIGIVTTLAILAIAGAEMGASKIFLFYGVPYLWVNHWIVAITYLHHNHANVEHFGPETWTYEKGALSTIDRDFGFIGRHLFHHIIDSHVIHHTFSRIPFYHAEEATEAIKPLLGDRYKKDTTPFFQALWESYRSLKYVQPAESHPDVFQWASKH
ncbi:Delta(12) fatty acid desaturase [Teratosphaeria destructans]|uniref:Delta(12) fatty acid desaturase n=1 Tax=Teratosphaeria destructans TaxID=418781 RepID=A0A9W7SSC0_9PEZI|nr:Delta(12) fatty acid desaturase [Teratosphaeria destructans]